MPRGRLAAEHLLEQGYQNIGIINGPMEWWESRQRESGWQEVLQAAGMADLERSKAEGDWTAASGYKAMLKLLDRVPDLEAIFISNDSMALGALQAAASTGRSVPDDLAVVGFDDIFLAAHANPPLTTVRVPAYGLGWTAAEILITLIEGDEDVSSVSLETELMIRESCGATSDAGAKLPVT